MDDLKTDDQPFSEQKVWRGITSSCSRFWLLIVYLWGLSLNQGLIALILYYRPLRKSQKIIGKTKFKGSKL